MKARGALPTVRSVTTDNGCEFLSQERLEDWINTIHRESLNGETAYAYDSRLAKAA